MKLVSTSNFELERTECSQRSRKPLLELKSDGKASEFTLSMLNVSLVPMSSHEHDSSSLLKSECDPDAETLGSNVEALAAAPVNDRNLMEGFELFGSVFSLLQLKQSSEADRNCKPTSVLDFNERTVSLKLTKEDSVAEFVEKDGLDSVVIDFEKANKKVPALSYNGKKESDHPSAVVRKFENAPPSDPDLHTRSKLSDQPDSRGASVIQLHPKDYINQPTVDALTLEQRGNFGFQNAVSPSDAQPLSSNPPRVDQIVRAVLQQSAELSGSHLLAAERQSHAGLTGQTLRLSLHPAELGNVQISVSKRGNRLQVTIVPDLESTGRLLLIDADQLVKSLGLASNNTDHVQVHVATPDGSFEMQTGGDLKQTYTRSENNRNGHDGQHSSSYASKASQQESQNSNETQSISRMGISDHKRGGAVYI
jgi:hypothetical protein